MKFSQIFMLLVISCMVLLSCGENLGERRKLHPNEQTAPAIEKPDFQKSAPKKIPDSLLKKKKKPNALDTLKPSVATLD
ncbi:hypothetical protein [Ulvibacterium marinum]|uniref:Lipoprotein n=1 Tax=Ulvibacterium marinum TaxID=2419782 RepID=A0A3B0C4L0_9FLAO|nr:hypothetical protein [Ulvibacterium marinum]RKN79438.1 hypothetical protein D7Z94_14095 [Ulvibacterium marinum]